MNAHDFSELLRKLIMLSISDRRNIFQKEQSRIISEMSSRGISLRSGVVAGGIGDLCVKEISIRADAIFQVIQRVTLDAGIQPFFGFGEMLKMEAVKYFPEDSREFKSIIDRLSIDNIKGDYFAAEFLSARLTAINRITSEIDLLILRLNATKREKSAVQNQTIYNISSHGGIVQTGDSSTASIVINNDNKQVLVKALDDILIAIKNDSELEILRKEETKELVEELKNEVERQKPNGIRLTHILFGLATAVQSIASMKPAYEALKAAALTIGIHLP